jgi:hypothetical protein
VTRAFARASARPTRSRRTPFPAVAAHSNRSLLGAVSVAGKRNFEARDKGAKMAVGIHLAARRDHAPARKPANSELFAKSREISVRRRLRGGAERTRTACQARSCYRTGLSRVSTAEIPRSNVVERLAPRDPAPPAPSPRWGFGSAARRRADAAAANARLAENDTGCYPPAAT